MLVDITHGIIDGWHQSMHMPWVVSCEKHANWNRTPIPTPQPMLCGVSFFAVCRCFRYGCQLGPEGFGNLIVDFKKTSTAVIQDT